MSAHEQLVGRTVELVFGGADATPDLHEFGALRAKVEEATPEGSPPTPKLRATVVSPAPLKGLVVTVRLRYEGEALEDALAGRAITVTAMLENAAGKAVAGGLAQMVFVAHA